MINQQLLDYVRSQRSAGLPKEAIIQALGAGGWTAADVNEAWMAIDGVKTPPPPPPPPPAPPVQPRQIIPPVQSAASAFPPAQPIIQPAMQARPVVAMSEFSTGAPRVKRKGRGILTFVIILLIIILLAAGAVVALIYINPALAEQYIPQLGLFFPAPVVQTPPDTTPLDLTASSSIDTSGDTNSSASTTIDAPGAASSSVQ